MYYLCLNLQKDASDGIMENIIKHLSHSFSEMGSVLTFVAIILIALMFIYKTPISEAIKKFRINRNLRKQAPKNKKVKDLWSHDLFLTVDTIKNKMHPVRFTTHGEYDAVKTKLLKALINNQLDNFHKRMKDFINKECIDNFDGQKLKYLMTEALKKGTREYNEKSRLQFIEMGISEEDAVFLIYEYGYFRDEVLDGILERIDSITTNENYNSNFDRLSAVFEVLAMGLYLIPKDSRTACNNINGRFKKYTGRV